MAVAALPAARAGMSLAERGGQAVAKALTADIVVVNGKVYREIKTREPTGKLTKSGRPQMRTVRRLEPTDVDVHINPVVVALGGGIALLAAGVGLWWMGLGVSKLSDTRRAALEAEIEQTQRDIDALQARIDVLNQEIARFDMAGCRAHCYEGHHTADWIAQCLQQCEEQIAEDKAELADKKKKLAAAKALLASDSRKLKAGISIENRPRFGGFGGAPSLPWPFGLGFP